MKKEGFLKKYFKINNNKKNISYILALALIVVLSDPFVELFSALYGSKIKILIYAIVPIIIKIIKTVFDALGIVDTAKSYFPKIYKKITDVTSNITLLNSLINKIRSAIGKAPAEKYNRRNHLLSKSWLIFKRFVCYPLCCSIILASFKPVGKLLTFNQENIQILISASSGRSAENVAAAEVSSSDWTRKFEIESNRNIFKRTDPENARFHLEDYYETKIASEEEYSIVFFSEYNIDYSNILRVTSVVNSVLVEIMDCQKPCGINTASEAEKAEIEEISDREQTFKDRIQHHEKGTPLESSTVLQQIVDDWKNIDEQNKCIRIYWMMANAYQEFALEYYNQEGGNSVNAKYYYIQSIVTAMEALKYAEEERGQYKRILFYISGRYKDLAEVMTIMTPEERYASEQLSTVFREASKMV